MLSTGKSARLPEMTCGSTPSGSVERMRLMAEPIFCSAPSRFVPYSKLAETVELPVVEVDEVSSSPWMPRTACSIGALTRSLTTAGAAPV